MTLQAIHGERPHIPVEALLAAWLPAQVGDVHVTAELPADFLPPMIVVDRISGADENYKLDRPVVDIDCYGTDRVQAAQLAELVRTAVRFALPLAGAITVGDQRAVVTGARTVVGPRVIPVSNPNVRRYSAVYELLIHPLPAA